MLVAAGVIGLGTVVFGSIAVGSAAAVVWLAVLAARGKLKPPSRAVRAAIAGGGVALVVLGQWVSGHAQRQSTLFVLGVAVLSAAGLLALAAADPGSRRPTFSRRR